MKLKNGRIRNINRKLLAGTLALVFSTTMLAGCTGDESSHIILGDTVLAAKKVVTFEDGSKDVVKEFDECYCDALHYCTYWSCTSELPIEYVDANCKSKETRPFAKYVEIVDIENILNYLTDEEKKKAINRELTEEDITNIINRITAKTEKSMQKVK